MAASSSQQSQSAPSSTFVADDSDKSKKDKALNTSVFMNLGPQGSAEYGEEIKVPLKRVQGNGGEVKVGEVKSVKVHSSKKVQHFTCLSSSEQNAPNQASEPVQNVIGSSSGSSQSQDSSYSQTDKTLPADDPDKTRRDKALKKSIFINLELQGSSERGEEIKVPLKKVQDDGANVRVGEVKSLEAHSFEKVHPSMSSAQIERNQTSEATQSAGSTSTGWSQLHTTTPQTGNNSQVSKGAGPSVFVENDPDKSKQDNTLKNSIFMNLGKQGSAEYGEEVKVPVKKVQDDGGDFRVGEVKPIKKVQSSSAPEQKSNRASESVKSSGGTSSGSSQSQTITPQTSSNGQIGKTASGCAGISELVANDRDKSNRDKALNKSVFMNLGKQGSAEYGESVKVPLKKFQDYGGDVKVGEIKSAKAHSIKTVQSSPASDQNEQSRASELAKHATSASSGSRQPSSSSKSQIGETLAKKVQGSGESKSTKVHPVKKAKFSPASSKKERNHMSDRSGKEESISSNTFSQIKASSSQPKSSSSHIGKKTNEDAKKSETANVPTKKVPDDDDGEVKCESKKSKQNERDRESESVSEETRKRLEKSKIQVTDTSEVSDVKEIKKVVIDVYMWIAACMAFACATELIGTYVFQNIVAQPVGMVIAVVALPRCTMYLIRAVDDDARRMSLFYTAGLYGLFKGMVARYRQTTLRAPPAFVIPLSIALCAKLDNVYGKRARLLLLLMSIAPAMAVYVVYGIASNSIDGAYFLWMVIMGCVAAADLQTKLGAVRDSKLIVIFEQIQSVVAFMSVDLALTIMFQSSMQSSPQWSEPAASENEEDE